VEGLTIFALIAGPVASVLITRWFDRSRAAKDRQLDVFRELMRTRRGTLALSPDHVKALNLVEIEFYGSKFVLDAHRALIGHFAAADSRSLYVSNPEWYEQYRTLLSKLLSEMAALLGYGRIQQLDVFRGGYAPTVWQHIDEQQMALRLGFIDLLNGKRSLPVHVAQEAAMPVSSPSTLQSATVDRVTN
jgi:hypothetical protein